MLEMHPNQLAFYAARAITGLLFIAYMVYAAVGAYHEFDLTYWLRSAFLTIAWFWLLCPTQNPWYWAWALPLVVMSSNPVWLWMSGLVLIYYLRFWLEYHYTEPGAFGTPYNGAYLFHFVVVWIEFAPWFVWLGMEGWWRRGR